MKFEIRDSEFGIKLASRYTPHASRCIIIFALLLSLNFTGCLFMRPYTPSARLLPANQVSMAYSAGYIGHSNNYVASDVEYDYYTGEYVYTNPRTSVYSGSSFFTDIGVRTRISDSDFELGLNLSDFQGLALDAKYVITKPGEDVPLLALDAAVYVNGAYGLNFGASAGPVINIPFSEDKIFDLVIAAYFQHYRYNQFGAYLTGGNLNYLGPAYAVTPPLNSVYLYAGLEYALDNGAVIAPGVSYTYYLGQYDQPSLLTAGLTVKTNATPPGKKEKEKQYVYDPRYGMDTGFFIESATEMIKKGKLDRASAMLARGLEYYPNDYDISIIYGYCLAKLGKKKLSLKYYSIALEQDPLNADLIATVNALQSELDRK